MNDDSEIVIPGMITFIYVNNYRDPVSFYFFYFTSYCLVRYEVDYLKPKYSGFDFFLYDTTICTTSDEMEFIR